VSCPRNSRYIVAFFGLVLMPRRGYGNSALGFNQVETQG
jgi:hypothetical protein